MLKDPLQNTFARRKEIEEFDMGQGLLARRYHPSVGYALGPELYFHFVICDLLK